MNAILTVGAPCQRKAAGCFVLRSWYQIRLPLLVIGVPMSGRWTPGAWKDCSLSAWILKENKMQVPSASRSTTINGALQTPSWQSWLWHWHPCHLRVYWTVLWLQLVVCSQTTKSEKTKCLTLRLVKLARTVLPQFLFLENVQGSCGVQLNRLSVSKDELDSEIPPGEETRYGYIM